VSTINILGYKIYSNKTLPTDLIVRKTIINTLNPHCYCVAKKDQSYNEALHQSDILLPDGIGIVWAVNVLTQVKIKRFTGSDLHFTLMKKMNNTGGKVFYMGSSKLTLEKIYERVKIEFPNIIVKYYSPPYKSIFNQEDNAQILASINEFEPDVLFIGMTAPKQEKWAQQNKDQINAKVIASIGAVFDFYAGTVKRSGKFWIFLGLEWLPRLLQEPRRLWRRNFLSTPSFLWDVICAKFRMVVKRK
jgi:N-acetylglucosaminyldiphosphoundecaprenol N-acetyl-beta-D-mannosaminyltransferase